MMVHVQSHHGTANVVGVGKSLLEKGEASLSVWGGLRDPAGS